jgi:c-di-GMP-binding flagellar brake protein YcgR
MSSTPVSLIERRRHPRVSVELRCYSAVERTGNIVARTINISRTGLLMLLEPSIAGGEVPKLGDSVKVDVELPSGVRERRCIRCRGQVVRVQVAVNRAPLVALAIDQMDFRNHENVPGAERRRPVARAGEAGYKRESPEALLQ